jgi:hypothetical protein
MMPLLREMVRILRHARRAHRKGPLRYPGTATEICASIVEECWNEEAGYYRTSLHNYPGFYARDFGMCVDALLALGHRERVRQTLRYALAHYRRVGAITQQISETGTPFNYPGCEHPDALAFLLHSLVAVRDRTLVTEHQAFLAQEIARLCNEVVDAEGLVRRHIPLAGMRDSAVRDSSCYDNVMMAAIQTYAHALKIRTPKLMTNDRLLLRHFWTGEYFKDDRSHEHLTGDANVPVFWFGIIRDARKERTLFNSVEQSIQSAGLDQPCALRYEGQGAKTRMRLVDIFAGGWERDTVWLHLGNMYLQVLARLDPAEMERQLEKHRLVIEQERHYPEVLDSDGHPHRTAWFHADDSMLWAANFLALERRRKG